MKMRPNLDLKGKGKVKEYELLQKLLPLFSEDITLINNIVGFAEREGMVYYFNGQMPLFRHKATDLDSFKMFMSQLYVNGSAKQSEINRTFDLNPINMKRWTKKYLEGDVRTFYTNENELGVSVNRNPRVLSDAVIEDVQSLFNKGYSPSKAGAQLGLKADTLRKAIKSGKLYCRNKDKTELKKTMILVSRAKEVSPIVNAN